MKQPWLWALPLLAFLAAGSSGAQDSPATSTVFAPTVDPNAIVRTDQWFTRFMTTQKPLGEAGAELGNFVGGTWGHLLMGVAVWQHGDRLAPEFGRQMGDAFLTNAVLTGALKRLVGRRRPDGTTDTSWPSGHTSSTVAALTVLEHHMGGGAAARLPLVALGATVALSRVQHNRHWLSDTVVGAALGYACGRAACGETGHDTLATAAGLALALGALVREAEDHPAAAPGPEAGFAAAASAGPPGVAPRLGLWSVEF